MTRTFLIHKTDTFFFCVCVCVCGNASKLKMNQKYSLPTLIGLGVRVFANGPGDLGSIPGRVIPKTQKMVLDASLLSTQHYKVRIKGKVKQSRKGVAPSPTHWCSSYRKRSLRVTLDYGRQLYFLLTLINSTMSSISRVNKMPILDNKLYFLSSI